MIGLLFRFAFFFSFLLLFSMSHEKEDVAKNYIQKLLASKTVQNNVKFGLNWRKANKVTSPPRLNLSGGIAEGFYHVTLEVGEPPQRTEVAIDTGSSILGFVSDGCIIVKTGFKKQKLYQEEKIIKTRFTFILISQKKNTPFLTCKPIQEKV